MEIGLSLGSNQGDRFENLAEARRLVCAIPCVTLLGSSRIYETEPVGVPAEFKELPFLNAMIVLEYKPYPLKLLPLLQAIEDDMGRKRSGVRNSPRPIDLDIIYAGDFVVKSAEGGIPHPRWSERRFVVQPLCDLRPDLRIPGSQCALRDVLKALPPVPAVVLHSVQWPTVPTGTEAGRMNQ